MIKQVSGAQAGRYRAFAGMFSDGLTLMEIMEFCRDQPVLVDRDDVYSENVTVGHTLVYSGQAYAGDLTVHPNSRGGSVNVVSHVYVCGINPREDNDVSHLAFSDAEGSTNDWGDGWRGQGQDGTVWSFANGNYAGSGDTHIGGTGLQTLAGWKGDPGTPSATQHQGTYEVYVR